MKHPLLFCTLFLAGIICTSCNKNGLTYGSDFEKSRDVWSGFKKVTGNTYRYEVIWGSWTGFSSVTIITVTGGKITQRYFKSTPLPGNPTNIPAGDLEWTENENQINAHYPSDAAAALTLDQVYDEARTNWLIKRKNTTSYFEAKNSGMISSCGYMPDGCQDDCFTGINIAFIQALSN